MDWEDINEVQAMSQRRMALSLMIKAVEAGEPIVMAIQDQAFAVMTGDVENFLRQQLTATEDDLTAAGVTNLAPLWPGEDYHSIIGEDPDDDEDDDLPEAAE